MSPSAPAIYGPIAQLDRALDYESRCREFESLLGHQQRHFYFVGINSYVFNGKLKQGLDKFKTLFLFVRRKGMSKPPVKLGVDKSYLIEKERTSLIYNDSGLATTSLYIKEVRCQ